MKGTSEQEKNKCFYQRLHGLLSAKSFKQLMRYGLVGVGINAALYVCYLVLVFFEVEPKVSMSIVYLIGLGIGFYGHKNLTFFHTENFKHAIARYLIAHVGGYAINIFLLFAFVDYMNLSHALVQGIAIFIVAAYLFTIFKYWVFSEKNYANS
jgi:putative flippase GtrA